MLADKFGDKLWDAYQADGDLPWPVVGLSRHPDGHRDPDGPLAIISYMASQDPTPGLKYLNWMVLRYIQRKFRLEDLAGQRERLAIFDTLVKSRRIENRDIMQYRDFGQIFMTVKPYQDGDLGVNTDQATRLTMRKAPMANVLHDDATWTVVQPLCWEAERYWGSNTNWCTVAAESNWTAYTNFGPLYIFINHETKQRAQLCFPAMQFMDETDTPLPAEWWAAAGSIVHKLFKGRDIAYLAATPESFAPPSVTGPLQNEKVFDAFTMEDSNQFYRNDYFRGQLQNMPVRAQYSLVSKLPPAEIWSIVLTTNISLGGFKKLIDDATIVLLTPLLDLSDHLFPVRRVDGRTVEKQDLINFDLPDGLTKKIAAGETTTVLLESITFTNKKEGFIKTINDILEQRDDYSEIESYRTFRFLMSTKVSDAVSMKILKACDPTEWSSLEKAAIINRGCDWVRKIVIKVAEPETLLACYIETHTDCLPVMLEKAKIPPSEDFGGGLIYRYCGDIPFDQMTKAKLLPGFIKQMHENGAGIELLPYRNLKSSDIYDGNQTEAFTLQLGDQRIFAFFWGGHTQSSDMALINTAGEKLNMRDFCLSYKKGHIEELMEATHIKDKEWLKKASAYIYQRFDNYDELPDY